MPTITCTPTVYVPSCVLFSQIASLTFIYLNIFSYTKSLNHLQTHWFCRFDDIHLSHISIQRCSSIIPSKAKQWYSTLWGKMKGHEILRKLQLDLGGCETIQSELSSSANHPKKITFREIRLSFRGWDVFPHHPTCRCYDPEIRKKLTSLNYLPIYFGSSTGKPTYVGRFVEPNSFRRFFPQLSQPKLSTTQLNQSSYGDFRDRTFSHTFSNSMSSFPHCLN